MSKSTLFYAYLLLTIYQGFGADPNVCTITLQPEKSHAYDRIFNGYNCQIVSASYSFDNLSLQHMVTQLKPGNLRFPGGLMANFYEWKTDNFPYVQTDSPRRVKSITHRFNQSKKTYGSPAFRNLCRQFNVSPILVVNANHWTPRHTVNWIKSFHKDGLKVRHIELGNEVYLSGQNTSATLRIDDYIKTCREQARAIRQYEPTVQIAVCVPPFDKPRANWDVRWHNTLSKETFYDAIVHHEYTFLKSENVNPEKRALTLFKQNSIKIRHLVQQAQHFYKDKPLWITEWNLGFKDVKIYDGTVFHALWGADMITTQLEQGNQIQLSCFHQLVSSAFGVAEITPSRQHYTPLFPVFILFGRAAANANRLLPTHIQYNVSPKVPPVPLKAIAFQSKEKIRIFVVNKGNSYRKPIVQIGKNTHTGSIRMHTFTGKSLMDTPKITPNSNAFICQTTVPNGNVVIPPYSVNILEFNTDNVE